MYKFIIPDKNRFGEADKALIFKGQEAGYISIPFNQSLILPIDHFTFSIWVQLDQYHKTNYWETVKTDKYAPIFTKAEFEQTLISICFHGQWI